MQYRAGWVACAAALMMAACGGAPPIRVTLPPAPPPAVMTPASRIAWFNALVPVETTVETISSCSQGGACSVTDQRTELRLGNGTLVQAPEDLRPLLPANSETDRHIVARDRASAKAAKYELFGVVGLVAGFALFMTAENLDTGLDSTRFGLAVGVGAIGAILGFVGHRYRMEALDENRAAFDSYPRDLMTTFRICAAGLQLVPCQDGAPGAP